MQPWRSLFSTVMGTCYIHVPRGYPSIRSGEGGIYGHRVFFFYAHIWRGKRRIPNYCPIALETMCHFIEKDKKSFRSYAPRGWSNRVSFSRHAIGGKRGSFQKPRLNWAEQDRQFQQTRHLSEAKREGVLETTPLVDGKEKGYSVTTCYINGQRCSHALHERER